MKSPREARAAVIRAWDMLPPVSKLEVLTAAPDLAAALDEMVATVAALVDSLRSGLDEPPAWRPEADPAVTVEIEGELARLRRIERAAMAFDRDLPETVKIDRNSPAVLGLRAALKGGA